MDEYAVYSDYETGHEALVVMLGGSVYSPLTLRAAMKRFDRRNPRYIDSIVTITHLDPERTIKSLNKSEFGDFWKAIEQIEEWTVGNEEPFEVWSISGVHKKRGECLILHGEVRVGLRLQSLSTMLSLTMTKV